MDDFDKIKRTNNILIIVGLIIILFLLFLITYDIRSFDDLKSKYVLIRDIKFNISKIVKKNGRDLRKFGLIQKWAIKLPSDNYNNNIIHYRAERKLIITSKAGYVYYINSANGKIIKKTKTIKSILSPVHYYKDRFIIMANNGMVQSFDMEGNSKIIISPDVDSKEVLCEPCISKINRDRYPDVIVGDGGMNVFCFSGGNGARLWKFGDVLGAVKHSPEALLINNDRVPDVIAGADNGNLFALDGVSGWVIWKINAASGIDSRIIVKDFDSNGSKDILFKAMDKRLWLVNKNGNVIWKLGFKKDILGNPVTGDFDGDKYQNIAILNNGKLTALDAISKGVIWEFKPDTILEPHYGVLKLRGRADVIIGDKNGYIYIINGKTGRIETKSRIDSKISVGPIIMNLDGDSNPDILILSENKNLYVFTYLYYKKGILNRIF